MLKVELSFNIRGWVQQTVNVPQEVVDKYNLEIEKDNPDCEMLDTLLEPYIKYESILDQLDAPEDIELKK